MPWKVVLQMERKKLSGVKEGNYVTLLVTTFQTSIHPTIHITWDFSLLKVGAI
jgi:hypothetical protein